MTPTPRQIARVEYLAESRGESLPVFKTGRDVSTAIELLGQQPVTAIGYLPWAPVPAVADGYYTATIDGEVAAYRVLNGERQKSGYVFVSRCIAAPWGDGTSTESLRGTAARAVLAAIAAG